MPAGSKGTGLPRGTRWIAAMHQDQRIRLKRAYEPAGDADGTRILVDRLWPRGISKEDANLDGWVRELAPSPALRRWFGHDVERWDEFRRRYRIELEYHPDALARLKALTRRGPLTLVYGAKDQAHNHAIVLKNVLLGLPTSP